MSTFKFWSQGAVVLWITVESCSGLASLVSDQWQMHSLESLERIRERRIGKEGGERQNEGVNERESRGRRISPA